MKKQILITSILVVVALVAGFFLGYGRGGHAGHDPSPATDSAGGTKIKFWTCRCIHRFSNRNSATANYAAWT